MPRTPFITAKMNEETGEVEFYFPQANIASKVNLDDLPAHIQRRLALHGLEQKLRDSVAAPFGTEAQKRIDRFNRVLGNLMSGAWREARAAAEEAKDNLEILAEALAEAKARAGQPVDVKRALDYLKGLSTADRRKISRIPEIAAILAQRRGKAAELPDF